MVKHAQKICLPLFECVWPFCGVGTERFKIFTKQIRESMEALRLADIVVEVKTRARNYSYPLQSLTF